jgi:hypothetical protein
MILAEYHLPLRPVQAMPGAHPALQGATHPFPIAVRMSPLHLFEQRDRPQSGLVLQQRHDLALPYLGQRIRHLTARLRAGVLLRWQPWIAVDPASRALTDPPLGGDKLRVMTAELHVDSHLLVCDVSSRHVVLVLVVEEPHHACTRRNRQAGPVSRRHRSGQVFGRATPALRPTRPAIRSCRSPVIRAVALQCSLVAACRGEPTMGAALA